jgi:hypothetical protein
MVVMQESRRSRLQQGALDWELLHDIAEPGRYVEQITDESWTEHLRRFDRRRRPIWRCATAGWPSTSATARRCVKRYVVQR